LSFDQLRIWRTSMWSGSAGSVKGSGVVAGRSRDQLGLDDLDEGNELLGGLSGTRPQLGVDTALHTLQRHFGIRSFIGGREASTSRFVGSTTSRLRLIGLRSRHEGWRSGVMVWWTVRVSEGVGQLAVSGIKDVSRAVQARSVPPIRSGHLNQDNHRNAENRSHRANNATISKEASCATASSRNAARSVCACSSACS